MPGADRASLRPAIIPLLDHPDPIVRGRAAACPGPARRPVGGRAPGPAPRRPVEDRLRGRPRGPPEAREPGDRRRSDRPGPAEPRPRDPPRGRPDLRPAVLGDGPRLDLADALIARTGDPDLWTRLEAIRSLRQWFYRTADLGLQRRIVDAYLARMAVPDEPVVRKALAEGMYIMLDENLGGGVSLQRNLAPCPRRSRRRALEGREAVERDVLLGPILAALAAGNALQREALVRSFDGSFFRGRTYARQPTGMLDVGNDREFGFLEDPPLDRLEPAFEALLSADMPSEIRRRSIQLAAFFRLPSRSASPALRAAYLRGLAAPDPAVRQASAAVVADLNLGGMEADPAGVESIRALLRAPEVDRKSLLRAIARAPGLMGRPEIFAEIREGLRGPATRDFFPVVGHPSFDDSEVSGLVAKSWPLASEVGDRLALLDAHLARRGLFDDERPRAASVEVLRLAVGDPSAVVRGKALEAIGVMDRFRRGRSAERLLTVGLADESPDLRRVALGLLADREGFWTKPDSAERLLALLTDPDPRVRDRALAVVEGQGLARGSPALARRVKSLTLDPALRERAAACLAGQGYEPDSVVADVRPGRPRLPRFSTFRDRVNPWLDRPGEDGYSCARCHSNQGIVRVLEGRDPASILINYDSALKVVNLGDPGRSLLLRKPLGATGPGEAEGSGPTGLTHGGGPRWDGPDHPAYRAILSWIRESSAPGDDPAPLASADHFAPGHDATLAVDGDPLTSWQTESAGANPSYPHDLTLDLGRLRPIDGISYTPRQDSSRGRVADYEIWLSDDGQGWSGPVARGAWLDEAGSRYVPLDGRPGRFLKLRGLSEVNGLPSMSVGDLALDLPPLEATPR